MNIWKGMIFGGLVVGIITLGLSMVLPNYYQPGIGFFGLIAGLTPVVGYFMYRKSVPTAFTYADAKLEGKRVLWVFSEDKTVTPVHATFDSGKFLVGDTPVIVDSPEDIYLLDGVPTAIMYRPIGKTLDPKKLFFIRELEHLGYDKKSFTREMEKQAFINAFREKYAELIKAGYSNEQAEQEALAHAQKEMTNYNKMPKEMKIIVHPDGKREKFEEGGKNE